MTDNVKSFLAKLLPTSFVGLAGSASPEDFSAAEAEATELNARIVALSEGNTLLKTDLSASQAALTAAQNDLAARDASLAEALQKLTAAETDRDLYKASYDEKKANGEGVAPAQDGAQGRAAWEDLPDGHIIKEKYKAMTAK